MNPTEPTGRVAVLDDEPRMTEVLGMVLRRDGLDVSTWTVPAELLAWLEEVVGTAAAPDVLLTDVRMPGTDGLGVLARARQLAPELPVVLLTAHGTVKTAVQAMREGAWDFLEKPVDNELCRTVVQRALAWSRLARENRQLRERLAGDQPVLVAASPALRAVDDRVRAVARARAPVLITGETGTGKELLARLVHGRGARVGRPFLAVNCASLSAGVLESELFGHERGAFTGADRARAGLFERADGGTLFLDEIGEISPEFQAKLLRVLQEGEVMRVGGDRTHKVDVRVIAATHRDLRADATAGRFREDLYYRLAVLTVHVPPLRERPADIPPLAFHFLSRACASQGREDLREWAPDVERWLMAQPWPGNARQLSNTMERASVLAPGPVLEVGDLMPDGPPTSAPEATLPLHAWLDQQAAARIRGVLAEVGGVRVDAATRLGVDRTTLFRLMRKYGVE